MVRNIEMHLVFLDLTNILYYRVLKNTLWSTLVENSVSNILVIVVNVLYLNIPSSVKIRNRVS